MRLPCSCHPSPWPVGPGPDLPVRILLVSEGQRSRARIPGMLALCSPFADKFTQNPVTAKSRQAREPYSSCTPLPHTLIFLPSQGIRVDFIPYLSSLAGCLDAATPSLHGKTPCQRSEQYFPLLLILAYLALETVRATSSYLPHGMPPAGTC